MTMKQKKNVIEKIAVLEINFQFSISAGTQLFFFFQYNKFITTKVEIATLSYKSRKSCYGFGKAFQVILCLKSKTSKIVYV
jgi:hypothetical protein